MSSIQIKKSLSGARLSTYENITLNGQKLSTDQALKLYAWNAQISAAFFVPLHLCEVVIRNAVAEALVATYGANWPWARDFLRSLPNPTHGYSARQDLINIKDKMANTGKVIPELKFVFWEKLLTARFDSRLWDSHLFTVFPNLVTASSVSVQRNELRSLLENVRRLRNRIAHHEPIINRDIETDFKNISLLLNYRCKDTAIWAYKNQLVMLLIGLKPF